MNRKARRIGKAAFSWLWLGSILVFLLAPLVVVLGASLDGGEHAVFSFPPRGFSLAWYRSIPGEYFYTLGVSLALALVASLGAMVIGTPAALALVRGHSRLRLVLESIFRSPLQIPTLITGVAFLQFFYLIFDLTEIDLIGSFTGLAIAHMFISVPYVIGSVIAVLGRFDTRLEEAALILGASRTRAFFRVTLPVIMPGMYTGGLYAFILSFGDVPVSLFLAGSRVTTFPVVIFHAIETDFNPAVLSISGLVLIGSLVLLLILQRIIGLNTLLQSEVK